MSTKNIQTKYYFYNKFGKYLYKIPVYNTNKYFREKDVFLCLRKGERILYIPAVSELIFVERYTWAGTLGVGGTFSSFDAAIFPDGSISPSGVPLSSTKTLRYKFNNKIYYFLANKQLSSFFPEFNMVYLHIESAWAANDGDSKGFIIFSSYMSPSFPPNALKFKFHVKAISADSSGYNIPFGYKDVKEFDLLSSQEKAITVDYKSDHSRSIIPMWQGKCRFQITCEISDDVVLSNVYDFSSSRYLADGGAIYETYSLNIEED